MRHTHLSLLAHRIAGRHGSAGLRGHRNSKITSEKHKDRRVWHSTDHDVRLAYSLRAETGRWLVECLTSAGSAHIRLFKSLTLSTFEMTANATQVLTWGSRVNCRAWVNSRMWMARVDPIHPVFPDIHDSLPKCPSHANVPPTQTRLVPPETLPPSCALADSPRSPTRHPRASLLEAGPGRRARCETELGVWTGGCDRTGAWPRAVPYQFWSSVASLVPLGPRGGEVK